MRKYPTSIRISGDAKKLLIALAEELGVAQAAVIEIAVRDLAERKGIKGVGDESLSRGTSSTRTE